MTRSQVGVTENCGVVELGSQRESEHPSISFLKLNEEIVQKSCLVHFSTFEAGLGARWNSPYAWHLEHWPILAMSGESMTIT